MPDDVELYRRFLGGDEHALEQLIALYQPSLLRFIYAYVRDEHLAEDVFTDVFTTLYFKRPFQETHKATLKTYVYTIARNLSLNALKKRLRRREISLESLTEQGEGGLLKYYDILPHSPTPEQTLEKSERDQSVYEGLKALKKEHREVLFLRYFENLSPEEIAKITKKKVKQVYNLLARGKAALKEKLLEKGFLYEDV